MNPFAGEGQQSAVYEMTTEVVPAGPTSGATTKPEPRLPNPGVV